MLLKSCLVKASLSVDLTSASIETPSLNYVEKTEKENFWEKVMKIPVMTVQTLTTT